MKRLLHLIIILFACTSISYGQNTLSMLGSMHKVQKKETLWSIAQKYGITVEALEEANPEIKGKKLKKGTMLTIPPAQIQPVQTPITEEIPQNNETAVIPPAKPKVSSYKTINVAVILPLLGKDTQCARMVEFYQGFLMAVDSIKKNGTSINVYAWDCGNTAEKMRQILNENNLGDMNLVIGPANQEQSALLAAKCKEMKVRYAVPFATNLSTDDNPLLYLATAGNYVVQKEASRKLCNNNTAECNYICYKSQVKDEKTGFFVGHITDRLREMGKDLSVLNESHSKEELENALSRFKPNIIITDNADIRTLNILISQLNAFIQANPDYKISLIGHPEWLSYTGSLLAEYFKYDTYIYSPYYTNPLAKNTALFERKFKENFRQDLLADTPRHSMMGFDLGYYFLFGMARFGDDFEFRQGELQFNPFQQDFRFHQYDTTGGFTNHAVQIIHYTPEQTIEQIR